MENIINTEKLILSSLIVSDQTREKFIDDIKQDFFYHDKHKAIFKAISDLDIKGDSVDVVSIRSKVGEGEFNYILELNDNAVSTKDLKVHIDTIKESYKRRSLVKAHSNALNQLNDPGAQLDDIINTIDFETIKLMSDEKINHSKTLLELIPLAYDEMEKRSLGKGNLGIKSPLNALNEIIGGFCNGELWVLAALPSMGKTTFAVQIAVIAVMAGYTVLFYSFEMAKIQLVYRILSLLSGVSGERIAKKKILPKEMDKVSLGTGKIWSLAQNLIICDQNMTITEMYRDIRRKSKTKKIDLVITDYLQKQKVNKQKSGRNDLEIAEITNVGKEICIDFDIPIIMLAQFNRKGNRDGKPPRMSDLAGSSQIEADIDGFITIHNEARSMHRSETEEGETFLIVDKNRNGQTGKCQVKVDFTNYRFYDIDHVHDDRMDYQHDF